MIFNGMNDRLDKMGKIDIGSTLEDAFPAVPRPRQVEADRAVSGDYRLPSSPPDTSCNSACLDSLMQKYFDALAARKPADAPVTADVIFSENGVIQPFGEASWLTMDKRGDWELTTLRIKARGGKIA
jgi:hypothetical protein